MYVCMCNAINEDPIRKAREKGPVTLEQLQRELGVGNGCGQCKEHVEQMLCDKSQKKGR